MRSRGSCTVTLLSCEKQLLLGDISKLFLKISVIMTLSLGPPPHPPLLLASWQRQLIVIPGLEDSGRYTFRTFL